MGSKPVVFDGPPGHFETCRAVVPRTKAIAPVVIRREIAAGPAKYRHVKILNSFQDIFAKPVLIG